MKKLLLVDARDVEAIEILTDPERLKNLPVPTEITPERLLEMFNALDKQAWSTGEIMSVADIQKVLEKL